MYTYKMLQIPPNLAFAAKGMFKQAPDASTIAASYLQQIVNGEAQQGWEFFRVDSVGVKSQPGCIAALLGAKTIDTIYYVVTFRRPVA